LDSDFYWWGCALIQKTFFSAYAGAAIFADEDLAQTYMPLFIWPMLVVGGFYVSYESIPVYFRWLSYISWFRYAFEAMEVSQFEDLDRIEG
jgi:ABC-type multidrug transport system permease subunit